MAVTAGRVQLPLSAYSDENCYRGQSERDSREEQNSGESVAIISRVT